ncbi:MAG: permease, partial [Bacteroidales bacterium]
MKKIMSSNIFWPTVVMFIIALALFIIATLQGEGKNVAGLKSAWNMTLQIIPLLIFAFIIAGLVQTLLPRDLISTWVGDESGFRGILFGTLAGALTPGGPYVSLPIAAGLLKTGASIPTMVAFVT